VSIEHTPGPWTASARGYKSQVWSDGQMMTAEVLGPNHAANARLMAAAPDLLAALAELLNSALDLGLGDLSLSATKAANAIAKATGEETNA
jgi:hypothetical protein